MKKIFVLMLLIATCFTGVTSAQVKEGVKKEGAHQAEYNSDAQVRDHNAEINSRKGSERRSEDAAKSDAGSQSAVDSSRTLTPESNTIGTETRTTSSAGSPGMRVEENSTDGTNTMQRATLNIAGSPLPGSKTGSSASSASNKNQRSEKAKSSDDMQSKDRKKDKKKK